MSRVLERRRENCSGVRKGTCFPVAGSREVGKRVVWRGLFCCLGQLV